MRKIVRGICTVEGCDTGEFRHGYCIKHLRRWEQWGDPLMVRKGWDESLIERFTSRHEVTEDGCWPWTGFLNHGNYGRFTVSHTESVQAHRWSYEQFIGPIPDGLTIDHLCHNADPTCKGGPSCLHRRCVNPSHLEPKTIQDNLLSGNTLPAINARKTHCPQGHPYDGVGTKGERLCRRCRNRQSREYLTRKRSR